MIKRCHPQKGDILLSRITGGILGFSKLVDWDYDFSIYVSLALLSKIQINPKYLNYYIQSPVYRTDFLSKSLLIASINAPFAPNAPPSQTRNLPFQRANP